MNILWKHPFLHAPRRWGRFARNVPAAKSAEKRMFSQAKKWTKKVWCTVFFFDRFSLPSPLDLWVSKYNECLNIHQELGLIIFMWAIEKLKRSLKRSCHKLKAYGRVHRTTTVICSPYALDFCQSAIDTIHYALPVWRLNALETRLSFPDDTSCKQKTEEAVVEAIWRKNYISL